MQKVVVFDKSTREVIACVPLDGQDVILRKDVDVQIFGDTEPVFIEKNKKVLLKENTFIFNG